MKYLLDTNACIEITRRPRSPAAMRFKSTLKEDLAISIVTVGELWTGPLRKANPPSERTKLEAFLKLLQIIPFDGDCAFEFGRIAAHLFDMATPVGGLDIQIGATAKVRNLVVVTHNLRDFGRMPGLSLEDWH